MRDEQSEQVNQIFSQVCEEEINPLQAVLRVNQVIGGITGVDHRVGTSIRNHLNKISMRRSNLGKKEREKLEEFATLCYWVAQRNQSTRPGEVHLGRGLSSKHYKQGFQNYQNTLLSRYSQAN